MCCVCSIDGRCVACCGALNLSNCRAHTALCKISCVRGLSDGGERRASDRAAAQHRQTKALTGTYTHIHTQRSVVSVEFDVDEERSLELDVAVARVEVGVGAAAGAEDAVVRFKGAFLCVSAP